MFISADKPPKQNNQLRNKEAFEKASIVYSERKSGWLNFFGLLGRYKCNPRKEFKKQTVSFHCSSCEDSEHILLHLCKRAFSTLFSVKCKGLVALPCLYA